ncbi:MAG: starch-binding protein, partial [Lachnospiraceae bacterium]|nr:starch-binding protein [Lachnospiraceae bacterium]
YSFIKNNSIKIYAKNKAGWDKMFIHYWGGESSSVWPGYEMTLVEDSDDVYYAEVPAKTTNFKFNNGSEDSEKEEQTSNLATQDLVEGVSECYVINYLSDGETANTGSFTTLEKALLNEPEADKPIITINSVEGTLNSKINVNVDLQNTPKVSGYLIKLSYDASVIKPAVDEIDSSVTANEKNSGELYLVYAETTPKDYNEKDTLITIPFNTISPTAAQTKISVKSVDMYADEETKVDIPSSNLLYGKATIGVDKSVLKSKIDYVLGLNENDYSAISYQNLITAKDNAQKVYDSIESTQEKVNAQVEILDTAIGSLQLTRDDVDYFYFKNTSEWENVYAYWWGSETECPAFPGIKATKVDGTTDIYKVMLVNGVTGINFNDGSNEDNNKEQTDSITGDNLKANNIFIPNLDDTYEKNSGLRYRGEVTEYVPNVIYFLNNAEWDNVYVYWWGGSTECPAFPGIKANLVTGTTKVYSAILPEDATGFNFNNGKQGTDGGEQTSSISAMEKGKILIMDIDSKYEKNGGYRYDAAYDSVDKYLVNNDYIFFKNNLDWEQVYIYYWGGEDETVWPGVKMNLLEGETDIYYIKAVNATKVIFNNGGNGSQTIDLDIELNKIYIIDTSAEIANTKEYIGSWEKYNGKIPDISEKPIEEPTENPTEEPTEEPTENPTEKPTEAPTKNPSGSDEESVKQPTKEEPTIS